MLFFIDLCDIRGPFRTQNPRTSQNKWSYEICCTLLGHWLKMFENIFENAFNLCSHIESNTTNSNLIFKIKIVVPDKPKMPKYIRNLVKFRKAFFILLYVYLVKKQKMIYRSL